MPLELESILEAYYRVNGRSFAQCNQLEVWKHQVPHLAKLTRKLLVYQFAPTNDHRDIVCREVIPDLLIYAQELMLKSDSRLWSETAPPALLDRPGVLISAVPRDDYFDTVPSALVAIGTGMAAIADICDQSDHGKSSEYQIGRDVVRPFLRASASLCSFLDVEIGSLYQRRLEDMRAKYEGWLL